MNVGCVDAGAADGARSSACTAGHSGLPDGRACAAKFSGPYSHRVVDGIGHNVPQEAPEAFAAAVLDLGGGGK